MFVVNCSADLGSRKLIILGGSNVFSVDEICPPGHGKTSVVLNLALVNVVESYEYVSSPGDAYYRRLK